MNWYKKAQLTDITSFVADWIRSSADQAQDPASFAEQVQTYGGGMVDPGEMRTTIDSASSQVASAQGGQLTPQQDEFIRSIMTTVTSDPMGFPQEPGMLEDMADGSF